MRALPFGRNLGISNLSGFPTGCLFGKKDQRSNSSDPSDIGHLFTLSISSLLSPATENVGAGMFSFSTRGVFPFSISTTSSQIREHCDIGAFRKGQIGLPIVSHIGEKRFVNNGLEVRIISFNRYNDMLIEFSDGTKRKTSYQRFEKGAIQHPNIGPKSSHLFCGVHAKLAFQDGDKTYYTCTFPDDTKDICTPQEIMERQSVKPVF